MNSSTGSYPFPGVPTTADGSSAVVWVETNACSGASAYPITPATNMGVGFQQSVADGKKNVWGEALAFVEPESEHSAASVCEGFALAGGRVSNFTAGQGLILMKEVLYTIAGKRLPVVFNIGARALTVHALNVHAGHDDVMGVVDCGWGMLFARNAQEAADFCLISRRAAEDSHTPYFNIQDGFLTTHTVESVNLPEPDLVKTYLKSPSEALYNFMDTNNPMMIGTVQNQDAYMKGKIAQRAYYEPQKNIVRSAMAEFHKLTGRKYDLIDCYKMNDAEYAIVGMGSYMETARVTAEWLRKNKGMKVGVISILSYRPFPAEELVEALKNVKAVSVLERLDESSAPDNPLARDLKAAFADAIWGRPGYPKLSRLPIVQQGSGGLGGRDVRVSDFLAIADNLSKLEKGKARYCVGIKHPDNLDWNEPEPDLREAGTISLRGHSIGGYGAVTTNKVIASICGDLFNMRVQAFPKYGAEKKGLPTTYYLTIGPNPIRTHQELHFVNIVFVNEMNAFRYGDPLEGIIQGGSLVLQMPMQNSEEVWSKLPPSAKLIIKTKNIRLFCLDTATIAKEVASSPDLVQRMQGIVLLGAFLRLTPLAKEHGLEKDQLMTGAEKMIRKYFGKRGESVVRDNLTCVQHGFEEIKEVVWQSLPI